MSRPSSQPVRLGLAARVHLYDAVARVGTADDGPDSPIDYDGAATYRASLLSREDRELARRALSAAEVVR